MVRLKVFSSLETAFKYSRFNSKMVRLKVFRVVVKTKTMDLFQFQNGAIKSFGCLQGAKGKFCFNSKMVRLKVKTVLKVATFQRFQFQNGAIKSGRT